MSQLSLKNLRQVQRFVNGDPGFRGLGNIDLKLAIKVDKTAYLISFGGFSCHSVEKISPSRFRDSDCLIELTGDQWNGLLISLSSERGDGLLGLDAREGVVKAMNPYKKMDLYRYLTSVEAFLRAFGQQEQSA